MALKEGLKLVLDGDVPPTTPGCPPMGRTILKQFHFLTSYNTDGEHPYAVNYFSEDQSKDGDGNPLGHEWADNSRYKFEREKAQVLLTMTQHCGHRCSSWCWILRVCVGVVNKVCASLPCDPEARVGGVVTTDPLLEHLWLQPNLTTEI